MTATVAAFSVLALLAPLPVGAGDAARRAVVAAQQAQAAMPAYRVSYRSTRLENGETSAATLVFVAPDRYHAADLDGPLMETIRIGGRGWMKLGHQPWQPELMDSLGMLNDLRGPPAIDDSRYELRRAEALGPRELEGVKTLAYAYSVDGDGARSRVQVWVSVASGLPVRFESEFTSEEVRKTESWRIEYDPKLRVGAPVSRRSKPRP